jgi:hypothetical protein
VRTEFRLSAPCSDGGGGEPIRGCEFQVEATSGIEPEYTVLQTVA